MREVIVTGGSSGIGLATVSKLIADGYKVTNIDKRAISIDHIGNRENLRDITIDLNNQELVRQEIERVGEGGNLYALIANAGIHQTQELDEIESFNKIVQFNLITTYKTISWAAPYLKASNWPTKHIILTSSASSLKGNPSTQVMPASKAGLDSLARSLAIRHATDRILVNSINPGWVQTNMFEESLEKYFQGYVAWPWSWKINSEIKAY